MMNNLFSTFDPATSLNASMNWVSALLWMMLLPCPYWMMNNRLMMTISYMTNMLHAEFKMLLGKSSGITLMMVALFLFILINNFMGLMPYIFTSSSHMTFTVTMALPLWLSMMLFGWINKTLDMLAHLVPMGTPALLMPFMVVIETISNIIRPGSLAVRLTANMIAGHLLMSLLGSNACNIDPWMLPLIVFVQMMLMMFEAAVAIIQAYVFSVLSTLYISEVK